MALRAGDWQCKNTITGISPIFQGNKNKKSKSDYSKETGFLKGFLDICWYFWMSCIMIRPTNIQSTQKVSVFGYVLGESGPARIRKSPPKDEKTGPCLQLHPSSQPYLSKNGFWSKYLKFNGFFQEKKKLHVGKPSTKNPTQLRMGSKIRPAASARPWQLFQRDTTLMVQKSGEFSHLGSIKPRKKIGCSLPTSSGERWISGCHQGCMSGYTA